MRTRFYGRSDVGKKRPTNEDSFETSDEQGFGVVCDGMGGHEGGEVASRLAVEVLTESVRRSARRLKKGPSRKRAASRALACEMVEKWTQRANAAIFKRGGGDVSLRTRMGTTLALVLIVGDFAVLAHVGDSRIYLIREGDIELLTNDHSVIGTSRSREHPEAPPRPRKFVTRALGTRSTVEPDISLVDVHPGDVFVVCSDGLTDALKAEEIMKIILRAGNDRKIALRSLIHLANKRGGRDNVTVILGEVLRDVDEQDESTEELPLPGGSSSSGH